MTTQELIIGHFEGSLTQEDEQQLQQLLGSSTEARSMYDRHAGIHSLMSADVDATEPSDGVGKRALAASLMAIPEAIVGSAATAWFTLKVIGGLSAAVFGGLAIISIVTSNAARDGQTRSSDRRPPAVSSMPAIVPSQPPVLPQMVEASKTTLGEEARSKQASESSSPQRSATRHGAPAGHQQTHTADASTANGVSLGTADAIKAKPKVDVHNPR